MAQRQPDAENAEEIEPSVASGRDKKGNLAALSLGALGVVFGDIGTSPLYAMRQCLQDLRQPSVDPQAVLGVLCLIFWSLILMVCVKYTTFIIRADHDGEGGTLAMLALIQTKRPRRNTSAPGALILLVLAGSALLYGDGVITPAISVLSAVEGLKIAAPGAQYVVVPVALAILTGLFLLQSRGTGTVGNFFGPIMALWFITIAVLGVCGIVAAPQILHALNPALGAAFLAHHEGIGVIVLGAVVLCFTGAEALFADLSHFGRLPIVATWYGLVLPSLVLSYFGQGALMLLHPTETQNPFFTLVPHLLLWPVVILATLATIIASQALISGTFTLTEQAIHMGYFPRVEVVHTSNEERGQVYIGAINYLLMVACAGVVLGFRSSDRLAGAYGLAVIGTMIVTSLTYYVVLRQVWKRPRWLALPLVGFFLLLDLSFLAGNIVKIISGAWVPLVFAAVFFVVFWIWTERSSRFRRVLNTHGLPLENFRRQMRTWRERREGTGIFMTTRRNFVPLVRKNRWLRQQARHEQVLLITIVEDRAPRVSRSEMARLEDLGSGLWRLTASFGFTQHPDITEVLKSLPAERLKLDWDQVVCYLPEACFEPKRLWWQRRIQQIYEFLRNNSLSLARYLRVPPGEIIHVGVRLDI